MHPTLAKDTFFEWLKAAVAAASNTDDDSGIVDTDDCEGVVFVTTIEDSAATGVATMTIEQNTADSASGMAALSGAAATATCAVNDDLNGTLLIVDVHKPRERYLRANRTSATANIAFGPVIAIKYGTRKMPVTQGATVSQATSVTSPAEA